MNANRAEYNRLKALAVANLEAAGYRKSFSVMSDSSGNGRYGSAFSKPGADVVFLNVESVLALSDKRFFDLIVSA